MSTFFRLFRQKTMQSKRCNGNCNPTIKYHLISYQIYWYQFNGLSYMIWIYSILNIYILLYTASLGRNGTPWEKWIIIDSDHIEKSHYLHRAQCKWHGRQPCWIGVRANIENETSYWASSDSALVLIDCNI